MAGISRGAREGDCKICSYCPDPRARSTLFVGEQRRKDRAASTGTRCASSTVAGSAPTIVVVDARSKSGPFAALLAKLRQLWQRLAKCNPPMQPTEVSSKANPSLPPTKEQHMAFAENVRKALLRIPPPPDMGNNPADPSSAPARDWRLGFE